MAFSDAPAEQGEQGSSLGNAVRVDFQKDRLAKGTCLFALEDDEWNLDAVRKMRGAVERWAGEDSHDDDDDAEHLTLFVEENPQCIRNDL